ncbi:flagellar assembly peptidoglycan hydrolase FlgJ [Aquabacterium sp.]|uniref:flagellar assembly peptidoglycan hydrolase FlgJ n=1 Tax=Aquabacterium sp. TaxID=1872578 RepID=UPI0035B44367
MSIDSPASGNGNLSGMTLDLNSLNALKAKAAKDPNTAVKGAAKQLETLFMQELMKTMRASTLNSGMLENSGTQMGTEMLDTEFAGRMSGLPHGLSAAIERQLSRQIGGQSEAAKATTTNAAPDGLTGRLSMTLSTPAASANQTTTATTSTTALSRLTLNALQSVSQMPGDASGDALSLGNLTGAAPGALNLLQSMTNLSAGASSSLGIANNGAQTEAALAPASAANAAASSVGANASTNTRLRPAEAFVRQHQAAAHAIEAETGIPAANLIGQAAHESGWGRHEIKNKDGTLSHNLFGIKAGADWKGKVAEVTTTEYIGGVARRVTAKFRSYDSYEESFRDHAKLLTNSPRYSNAVAQASSAQGYAKSLQKAGYATDPGYADKLTRVINTALRLQRTVT